MLTEGDDGKCPYCNYEHMLIRYGSSDECLEFDACPKCGHNIIQSFTQNDKREMGFVTKVDDPDFWEGKTYGKTREEWLEFHKNDTPPVRDAREPIRVFRYHLNKEGKIEPCRCSYDENCPTKIQ